MDVEASVYSFKLEDLLCEGTAGMASADKDSVFFASIKLDGNLLLFKVKTGLLAEFIETTC
jgi:hypothetical protein